MLKKQFGYFSYKVLANTQI